MTNKAETMRQDGLSTINKVAWEFQAYEAWVSAYGTPEVAAAKLVENPLHKVRQFIPHLGDITNLNIAVPLGSHGRVAVSLALLGAV